MEHLGFAYTSESNGISYKMFRDGWCVYVFNLTNGQEDTSGFELVKDGSTAVMIRFAKAVPSEGVTLIAYAETDGLILIDRENFLPISSSDSFLYFSGNRTVTSDLTV